MLVKVLVVIGLISLGVIFWYWWSVKTPPAKPQPEQKYSGPVETINIANIGEYSIFNIIAAQKNFFTENGLNANITEYDAGPSAIQALFSGKAEVAVAADFVGVSNIFSHPNLRIISQASKHQVFFLVARLDKGIKTPSDLKGKKIGVTKKSAGEFFLDRFLIFNNLKLTDVSAIDLPPDQMINQL